MDSIKKVFLLISIGLHFLSFSQPNAFEVKVEGKGEPILLFPGFACPAEVYSDLVSELSKNYECHSFTFAGFGDVPPIKIPWLPIIKEAISSYILNEQLKSPTIIGHSLGGTLGLWLASENNHTFNKIIVIDALPSIGALMIPDFNSSTMSYDNPYNNQILNLDAEAFGKMAQEMANGMTLNEKKKSVIKDWMIQTDRKTYVYGYTDLLKLDLRQDISKIKTSVLILAATEPYGIEIIKQNYSNQYQNLDKYNIKFAENSAHFIMFDRPQWLVETIKSEL